MVVESVPVSSVISLTAHVGRSETQNLNGGHKFSTKGCWNVPFETPSVEIDGAPKHIDVKMIGEVASYCTMEKCKITRSPHAG